MTLRHSLSRGREEGATAKEKFKRIDKWSRSVKKIQEKWKEPFMQGKSQEKLDGKNKADAIRIIDSDGHVRETDEQIMEYMSPGYRSRRAAMLYFPLVPHHGWHRSIPQNDYRHQDFRVPDWREWADKLDEGKIELTVLYPTRFMHIGQIGDPRYAAELCRAYNDFLHDRFLSRDQRFRGMALLPLQDVAGAVKELRRSVKSYGMVGGI